jgi:F-type H+-transporting ATPase subunit gamma
MKKAQDQAASGRAYSELMNKILVALKESAEEGVHPFFEEGKGGKTLVLVIATDKGLCGALNTNLLKKLISTPLEGPVDYVTIGRKATQGLTRLRRNLVADFPIKDPAKFAEVRSVGKFLQEKFLTGEYTRVLVAFNNFINTVTQVPSI